MCPRYACIKLVTLVTTPWRIFLSQEVPAVEASRDKDIAAPLGANVEEASCSTTARIGGDAGCSLERSHLGRRFL